MPPEDHPPPENIGLDVTFTAFYRNIPALSIMVAVTFNLPEYGSPERT